MNNFLLIADGIGTGTLRNGFCAASADIWQVVGWILLVFKIVIPIILIVLDMIDLGKAVVTSKDDEIKKAVKSLAMRGIAAIIIFFIPTIIGLIMGLVGNFSSSGAEADYNVCKKCITNPNKCQVTNED